ncbi:hypothetical protein NCS52_01222600 [Fusarium sp. LHS14.1]|nr:hypothetical protein NCS52_01222600 [Fusarium sp. LHS14.1]
MADLGPPTGLFLVYEPKDQEPVVDIVIIHGLKGHAYKTWTSPLMSDAVVDLPTERNNLDEMGLRKTRVEQDFRTRDASSNAFLAQGSATQDCPKARILTYGYDTKITKYTSGSTSKNSVFSHSKDFLFALGRIHAKDRPLIFLAHSLGGIVVREMLALSSTSPTDELCNIVTSTAAVKFLGTPHRGSPDLSAVGTWAKSVLGGLRFQTNSTILDTLGLKTTDLERSQEAFSGLWFQHGFRVVPDTSSLIGDQRERAETLQANHMKMCRFSGRDDPNFVKVVGELQSAYYTILTGLVHDPNTGQTAAFNSPISNVNGHEELTAQQAACLKSLQFSYMYRRRQFIEDPAPQTGRWLIENETYSHWLFDRDLQERPCILSLRGKPGAGKSTMMKQAFRHAKSSLSGSDYCVAGVFISAKGEALEHSTLGVFRSLLHQLLPHYPAQLQDAVETWIELNEEARLSGFAEVMWGEPELRSLLSSIIGYTPGKRTIIFIDGLDELQLPLMRTHLEFWGLSLIGKNNGRVRVCLVGRHYPQISLRPSSELIAEDLNKGDISTYVNQRLSARIAISESLWEPKLRNKIIDKAGGIFLWVILTVDRLLVKYDQGKSLEFLLKDIDSMPEELESLLTEIVKSISPELRMVARRAFQWALMSTTPLRLHQWHHVLAFIKRPVPKSLDAWRKSLNYTASDSQLERELKTLSGGLLEVSAAGSDEAILEDEEYLSIRAGAGSLDLEQGETRIVQVIHESVRDFFLKGSGSIFLGVSAAADTIRGCHTTIAITCFNYIYITELDGLVDARRFNREREDILLHERVLSATTGPAKSLVIGDESSSTSEEGNREQDSTNDLQETFAKRLNMMPVTESHADIAFWLGTRDIHTNPTSSAASSRYANSTLSAANVSCQLEDWPSLFFYITSSLATHLRAATEPYLLSDELHRHLNDENLWARFVLLNEDIPWGTTLRQFISGEAHASVAHSTGIDLRAQLTHQGLGCNYNKEQILNSTGIIPPPPVYQMRSPSRAGSVASFLSASSYATMRENPPT